MHVLLFDIDGTLVNTRGSGLQALKVAFAETFACSPPSHIDTAGRTDRGIAEELFLAQSIDNTHGNWVRFRNAYLRHLADQMPRHQGVVLPGVVRLLEELGRRSHVSLGLLTGNVRDGARIKLSHFGLHEYFRFGGFGERHPERNAVAEEALRAARRAISNPVAPDRVWVIGDTVLDIRCARHIGARAVAVATGFQAKEDLAQHQPDLLLDNLDDAAELLQRLEVGSP
jgi:phosphoglycolate phosphatase-like HAD superfamily hydrolase